MRAFNFTLLAVFSCISMIGATPIGDSAPAKGIGRRQDIDYCTVYPIICEICDVSPTLDFCKGLCDPVPSGLDVPQFCSAGPIHRRQDNDDYCTINPTACQICDATPTSDSCQELCNSVPSWLDPPKFCSAASIGRRQGTKTYCATHPLSCLICVNTPTLSFCKGLCNSVPSGLSFCNNN